MTNTNKFPGGSKSRVNLAGENIRNAKATLADLKVIEEWRAAHRSVLNTFQAILRTRVKGTNISVAQRHKRRNTIFDKLQEGKRDEGKRDGVIYLSIGWRVRGTVLSIYLLAGRVRGTVLSIYLLAELEK